MLEKSFLGLCPETPGGESSPWGWRRGVGLRDKRRWRPGCRPRPHDLPRVSSASKRSVNSSEQGLCLLLLRWRVAANWSRVLPGKGIGAGIRRCGSREQIWVFEVGDIVEGCERELNRQPLARGSSAPRFPSLNRWFFPSSENSKKRISQIWQI